MPSPASLIADLYTLIARRASLTQTLARYKIRGLLAFECHAVAKRVCNFRHPSPPASGFARAPWSTEPAEPQPRAMSASSFCSFRHSRLLPSVAPFDTRAVCFVVLLLLTPPWCCTPRSDVPAMEPRGLRRAELPHGLYLALVGNWRANTIIPAQRPRSETDRRLWTGVSRQAVIIGSSAQKNLAGGATRRERVLRLLRFCSSRGLFRRRKPAGFIGRRARTGHRLCCSREALALAEMCSPVGRVSHGIRRVSVVWLITDVDPLEAIPAPAGAIVASCRGER